jgi:multisite-specific tRNA:(cytosine-C5)-methyltransferase
MGDGRDRDAGAYDLQIGTSKDFETYYQSQNVLEPEEWDEFLSVAQQPLPTTFRVTSSRAASKAVNAHVEQEFVPFLSGVVYEGVQQQPPRKLTWYPGGHAWQLNTAKHVVRKSPEFAKWVPVLLLRRFLLAQAHTGSSVAPLPGSSNSLCTRPTR